MTQKTEPAETQDWIRNLNESPVFKKIASSLDYERIGIQIIKDDVVDEYTAFTENGEIVEIREGLHNPDFVAKIDLERFRDFDENEGEWAMNNPLQAASKYWNLIELPFRVKLKIGFHLLREIGE